MHVEIRSSNLMIGQTLRESIQQQVVAALGRFEQRVRHVIVRLGDLNGPHGGVDKYCAIALTLNPCGMVMAEATEPRWEKSLHHALKRVVRQVKATRERRVAMRVRSVEAL